MSWMIIKTHVAELEFVRQNIRGIIDITFTKDCLRELGGIVTGRGEKMEADTPQTIVLP